MIVLSPEELIELTKKERPSAQARVLEHLGIPLRARPDGTLVVLRVHVEATQDSRPRREPRLRLEA